jgi:fructose-1,6-bisphosphatase/inositol monophosphatase family enzyme
MRDETYWSVRGGGSFLNRERLHVSAISSIHSCVFSPNGLHLIEARPYLQRVVEFMQQSWAVRTYGGPLDACLLAAGRVEIWFEPKLEVWDLAALKLIIEEAGGDFFALDGSRRIDRGTAIRWSTNIPKPSLRSASHRPETTAERHAADRSIGNGSI